MYYTLILSVLASGMLIGMLVLMEVGRRMGARHIEKDPEGARAGIGTIEGAVFALLSLLLAFTISGAALRFDARRQLVVEEANAIGTAYLRVDLLPAELQPELRELFREYLDSRVQVYLKLPDIKAAEEKLAGSTKLQGKIWTRAVAACREGGYQPAAILLLPAINQMIDITTTRTMATKMHPPQIIFWLLFGLGLGCSLLAGYSMAGAKTRNWIHMTGFTAVMAVTLFVILDIEFPLMGLIRTDAFDQVLVQLLESMK